MIMLNLRALRTCLLALVVSTTAFGQTTSLDIDLRQVGTSNTLEVFLRPNGASFSGTVSLLSFTIRWRNQAGTLSAAAVGSASTAAFCPANLPNQSLLLGGGGTATDGTYKYRSYTAVGVLPLSAPTVNGGCNNSLPVGVWTSIATIPVTGITQCAEFAIVNDAHTATTNGDYYAELDGITRTGIIDANLIGLGACTTVVPARVMLEGPYVASTGLMNDNLRSAGLIPSTEPYTALGYTMENPGATVLSSVLNTSGNNAPVDWVMVELKNAVSGYPVVARRACLVRRDGTVITPDGNTVITFATVNPVGKHLVIHHRNHLGIMSASPIATSGQSIDFTVNTTVVYGTDAMQVNGTRMAMYPGNVNSDNVVKYTGTSNDRDLVLTTQLLQVAQFMQRFYTANDRYDLDRSGGQVIDKIPDGLKRSPADGTQLYQLSVDASTTAYTLTMAPLSGKSMANDKCGSYTLTSTGTRGVTGATLSRDECWK